MLLLLGPTIRFKFGCPHQLTHTHKSTKTTTDEGPNSVARTKGPAVTHRETISNDDGRRDRGECGIGENPLTTPLSISTGTPREWDQNPEVPPQAIVKWLSDIHGLRVWRSLFSAACQGAPRRGATKRVPYT
jgi:hypothetical protein